MPVPVSLLERLHRTSIHHRSVEAAATCGCFFCGATFHPAEIAAWVDEGDTALCPRCGIDSVLAGNVGAEVLAAMHAYWFGRSIYFPEDERWWHKLRWRLMPLERRVVWFWRTHLGPSPPGS
ncbi:MAG: hypothetical protein IPK12_19790 [Gemmatimonadetes bacterium]|nr:hypothetical protein [Gemmatimonadota bacterium]